MSEELHQWVHLTGKVENHTEGVEGTKDGPADHRSWDTTYHEWCPREYSKQTPTKNTHIQKYDRWKWTEIKEELIRPPQKWQQIIGYTFGVQADKVTQFQESIFS